MNQSLPSLAYVCMLMSAIVYVLTEAVSRKLEALGMKENRWVQLGLAFGPMVLGGLVFSLDGTLPFLMTMAGYIPKNPPVGWVASVWGVIAGAGSVVFHSQVKAFVNRKKLTHTASKDIVVGVVDPEKS